MLKKYLKRSSFLLLLPCMVLGAGGSETTVGGISVWKPPMKDLHIIQSKGVKVFEIVGMPTEKNGYPARPVKPSEYQIHLWTKDGKKWRASWIEDVEAKDAH